MASETFIGPITIRQSTGAGAQFGGTGPTGSRTVDGRYITYPAESGCGLFDFSSLLADDIIEDGAGGQINPDKMDLVVVRISFRLGAPTSWALTEIDPDGNEVIMRKQSAASETDYYLSGEDLFLPAGCSLSLATVAASAVQAATITVVPDVYNRQ